MKKGCLLVLFLALLSCGDNKTQFSLPSGGSPGGSGPPPVNAPAFVVATSTTLTLVSGDTANIVVTVTDSTGTTTAPDGTKVTFTTSSGQISPQATTAGGKALATFTAGSTPGTATIIATSGTVPSGPVVIKINLPETGGILFVSATPQTIGVKGSGQGTHAVILFLVTDNKGNPVGAGRNVDFAMGGPSGGKLPANGGEFIGDEDDTPKTASASTDINGRVKVNLNSGAVTGVVSITASITEAIGTTTTMITRSTTAPAVSIGGGVVDARHFGIAASVLNLPATYTDITSKITAYLGDRVGNFNILRDTSVSFYTEAGLIDTSATASSDGIASVIFRTNTSNPFQVAALSPPNPLNGHVTVLATVIGQESFDDLDGNGLYNPGEPFINLPEPFIDRNSNGVYDATGEFYIDADDNNSYSGSNGVWDGPGCTQPGCLQRKTLWDTLTLAFTSEVASCTITTTPPPGPNGFFVANGTVLGITVTVADINGNPLLAGTTISLAASKGTLAGSTVTLGDGVFGGATRAGFSLPDPDTNTDQDASVLTATVKHGTIQGVSFPDGQCSMSGTIQ